MKTREEKMVSLELFFFFKFILKPYLMPLCSRSSGRALPVGWGAAIFPLSDGDLQRVASLLEQLLHLCSVRACDQLARQHLKQPQSISCLNLEMEIYS